jgi:hypothetical protein
MLDSQSIQVVLASPLEEAGWYGSRIGVDRRIEMKCCIGGNVFH